jgi:hypothetical protein
MSLCRCLLYAKAKRRPLTNHLVHKAAFSSDWSSHGYQVPFFSPLSDTLRTHRQFSLSRWAPAGCLDKEKLSCAILAGAERGKKLFLSDRGEVVQVFGNDLQSDMLTGSGKCCRQTIGSLHACTPARLHASRLHAVSSWSLCMFVCFM